MCRPSSAGLAVRRRESSPATNASESPRPAALDANTRAYRILRSRFRPNNMPHRSHCPRVTRNRNPGARHNNTLGNTFGNTLGNTLGNNTDGTPRGRSTRRSRMASNASTASRYSRRALATPRQAPRRRCSAEIASHVPHPWSHSSCTLRGTIHKTHRRASMPASRKSRIGRTTALPRAALPTRNGDATPSGCDRAIAISPTPRTNQGEEPASTLPIKRTLRPLGRGFGSAGAGSLCGRLPCWRYSLARAARCCRVGCRGPWFITPSRS